MTQVIDMFYKAPATTTALNKRQNDILGGNCIIHGFNPTAQATPSMAIDAKLGTTTSIAYISGVRVEETADVIGAWTVAPGSAGQIRHDLLCCRYVYGATGTVATYEIVQGANGGILPVIPDLSYVALGSVTVVDAPTAITQAMIVASLKSGAVGTPATTSTSGSVRAAALPLSGDPVAQISLVRSLDVPVTVTTPVVIATYTPLTAGNFTLQTYFRVVTAITTVTIVATYTDQSGAQTSTILSPEPCPVGSYATISELINSVANVPIVLTVTASAANQVFVSFVLTGV